MVFICEHCKKSIHGVAAVYNGNFIHHRCTKDYTQTQIIEKWKASGLLEGLTPMKEKINLATLYEGKDKQIITE